jgi:Replication-relaxation
LLASLRHVLSTQIHRHFNLGRAATTTQRRLKRLADAGWVRRFQFHRRDGGGVPMCYVIADAGIGLLDAAGRLPQGLTAPGNDACAPAQARHDVHVSGWVLAVHHALEATVAIRGPQESVLSPPFRTTSAGRAALGPGDLRLPGGRAPHDFLRTGPDGNRQPVERFETVRPDASLEVRLADAVADILVEFDDRLPCGRAAAKLERYDHLTCGWATETPRYGRRLGAPPLVVFVCRDAARARECARRADPVLTACRAYAGEYPAEWQYTGRERILFATERDAHEGRLSAWGVPALPPEVRVAAAGDPRARAADLRVIQIVQARERS